MRLETRFSPINLIKSGKDEWIGLHSTDFPWHIALNCDLSWFETRWIIILKSSCLNSETDLILYGREVQHESGEE